MSETDASIIKNYKTLCPSNKKMVKDYISIVVNAQHNTEKYIEKNSEQKNA